MSDFERKMLSDFIDEINEFEIGLLTTNKKEFIDNDIFMPSFIVSLYSSLFCSRVLAVCMSIKKDKRTEIIDDILNNIKSSVLERIEKISKEEESNSGEDLADKLFNTFMRMIEKKKAKEAV